MSVANHTAEPEIERAAMRALAIAKLVWQRLVDDDGQANIAGMNSAELALVVESLHRELDLLTDHVSTA